MKNLKDPVRKVNSQCVGLDVHKKLTVYCVFNAKGEAVGRGRIASSRQAIEKLMDEILKDGPAHFTFEASRSSLWVYGIVSERVGAERTHVAQAKKIRAIANSNTKNDNNDAWWLGYLTYEGRLPEAYVPPQDILELRIATRERAAAVKRRTEVVNRLKAHLAQIGQVVPSSSIRTEKARLFLAEVGLQTPGVRGRAIRGCLDEIDYDDAAIAEWEELIEELSKKLPAVAIITEHIPGVGKTLAATIVAEAGDIKRFDDAKAFGRASGLTPSDGSTSGKTIHGGITREGSSLLRWALTQAVMACTRSVQGPGLAVGNWVRAKEKRMGVKAKARAAGARKLAESVWRLFHYGECFDAARPFSGNQRPA